MTALVRKESIEELCGHRARALELYVQAFDLLTEAGRVDAAMPVILYGVIWEGVRP